MKNQAKIAEFTACGRDELAAIHAEPINQPASMKRVSAMMDAVLDPAHGLPVFDRGDRPLNEAERRVIRMLIDYNAAEVFGVYERLIRLAVEIAFEVDDLDQLRARQFDDVVRYLVYLQERGNA